MLLLLCGTGEKNLDDYFNSVQKSVRKVASFVEADLDGLDEEKLRRHMERAERYFDEMSSKTNGVLTCYYRIDPEISDTVTGFWYTDLDGEGFPEHEVTDITRYDTSDSYATFNGKRVGANMGSVQIDFFRAWAEANGVQAELVEMTGLEEENLQMLSWGEIDAYIALEGVSDPRRAMPVSHIGHEERALELVKLILEHRQIPEGARRRGGRGNGGAAAAAEAIGLRHGAGVLFLASPARRRV